MSPDYAALPRQLNDAMAAVQATVSYNSDKEDVKSQNAKIPNVSDSLNVQRVQEALANEFNRLTRIYQERVQPYLERDKAWMAAQESLRGLLANVGTITQRIDRSETAKSWKGQDADLYRQRMATQLKSINEFTVARKSIVQHLEDAIIAQRAAHLQMLNHLSGQTLSLRSAIDAPSKYGESSQACLKIMSELATFLDQFTDPNNFVSNSRVASLMEKQKNVDEIPLFKNHTWPGAPQPRRMTGGVKPMAF